MPIFIFCYVASRKLFLWLIGKPQWALCLKLLDSWWEFIRKIFSRAFHLIFSVTLVSKMRFVKGFWWVLENWKSLWVVDATFLQIGSINLNWYAFKCFISTRKLFPKTSDLQVPMHTKFSFISFHVRYEKVWSFASIKFKLSKFSHQLLIHFWLKHVLAYRELPWIDAQFSKKHQ